MESAATEPERNLTWDYLKSAGNQWTGQQLCIRSRTTTHRIPRIRRDCLTSIGIGTHRCQPGVRRARRRTARPYRKPSPKMISQIPPNMKKDPTRLLG